LSDIYSSRRYRECAFDKILLMAKEADSKVTFKILEARLLVEHIEANPSVLYAHNTTVEAGGLAKYHLTRVEVKTFTFAAGSQSLSIDNAVLGPLPKRMLFTLVKNTDYLGTPDSNPYSFRHYGIVSLHCTLTVDRFLAKVCVSTLDVRKRL
jgi:hypothetical protein